MATSFEKSVRAFINDIRRTRTGGMFFADDPDAKGLAKCIYYGWVWREKNGPQGLYRLFVKTKQIDNVEKRALRVAEQMRRPWPFDVFFNTSKEDIFLKILNGTSSRGGNAIGRTFTDTEIPNFIREIANRMQKEGLTWYTPYLMQALTTVKLQGLRFQAECDLVDKVEQLIDEMLRTEEASKVPTM